MKDKPYEQLIYAPRTHDIKEFEKLGRAAKDAGFTHLFISQLWERTDYLGDDKDSPWCEWSKVLPAIFKHVTPPGLERAYGAESKQRQLDWMKRKHDVCEKLGMKAAYFGCEPHWLSERVYEDHPEWRGARCDNSLRTVGMFFAPNTDEPGLREAYRVGMKMVVEACPLIDTFTFCTNDSGAGYPWTDRLYVNPNGPTGYETKDMGHRVAEFLSVLHQGAVDGGATDARVFSDVYFKPHEKNLIARSLKPGIGISGYRPVGDDNLIRECAMGHGGSWGVGGGLNMDPLVANYPQPMGIVDTTANIRTSKTARFQCGGASTDFFDAFRLAMENPPAQTPSQKLATLLHMAAGMYGGDVAEDVVAAWQTLERVNTMLPVSAADMFGGPVMLRWLIRPLVAHQELLTDDEKAYWIEHIYQSEASDPATYLDYANVCGMPEIHGWNDATLKACAIDVLEGTLGEAAAALKAIAEKATQAGAREKLMMTYYSVAVLRCILKTSRHFTQVEALTIIRKDLAAELAARGEVMTSTRPEAPDLAHGNMGSHGLFYLHRALRWELDNVHDLIGLLRESPQPVIFTAPDDAHEGSLVLGPDLIPKLEKKSAIMLKHWREAEIGWYRPTLGG
ncbi:MAG: hypothetical protein O3A51_01020 [Verrucomicrobia bacterium]|nr:hypothetical protein [Verrucomicrobiota bacterium]